MIIGEKAYAPFDNKSGMCSDGNPSVTASGARTQIGTSIERLLFLSKISIFITSQQAISATIQERLLMNQFLQFLL